MICISLSPQFGKKVNNQYIMKIKNPFSIEKGF